MSYFIRGTDKTIFEGLLNGGEGVPGRKFPGHQLAIQLQSKLVTEAIKYIWNKKPRMISQVLKEEPIQKMMGKRSLWKN
jgi:hypothetical protein